VNKYRVTIRSMTADADGRKATVKKFVKAASESSAERTVLYNYPGWELVKVEKV
jgi:hypothetical protein